MKFSSQNPEFFSISLQLMCEQMAPVHACVLSYLTVISNATLKHFRRFAMTTAHMTKRTPTHPCHRKAWKKPPSESEIQLEPRNIPLEPVPVLNEKSQNAFFFFPFLLKSQRISDAPSRFHLYQWHNGVSSLKKERRAGCNWYYIVKCPRINYILAETRGNFPI